MNPTVTTNDLGAAAHDLSIWGLFLQADWVVKLVMILLLLASIWVWAIVFDKVTAIRRANRAADSFEDSFWSGGSLDELFRREGDSPTHPMAAVFVSAMREWRRSASRLAGSEALIAGLRERVDRAMTVTIQREMDRLERWMVFLASVGSVAPFIGLFGTVWGIMNSFIEIGGQKSASLDVVAPGIAEALIATAIGLVAAIPAVMAYNYFLRRIHVLQTEMDAFTSDYLNIVRRHFLVH